MVRVFFFVIVHAHCIGQVSLEMMVENLKMADGHRQNAYDARGYERHARSSNGYYPTNAFFAF